jgi:predicted nucleic acid-binding protein
MRKPRVLFDTSVLVASLVRAHPFHDPCADWHRKALRSEIVLLVAAHTLLELYASLTRLPVRPAIQPSAATRLIREGVISQARTIELDAAEYLRLLDDVCALGLAGGVVYDALIARAAEVARADLLLTLNPGHFKRVWPEGMDRIRVP